MADTRRLKLHPLCAIFPKLEGDEYRALLEDVRKHGVHDPITRHDGQVLDGQNRYRAALDAGIDEDDIPMTDLPPGTDPAAFVLSRNIQRRELSKEQRAQCVVRVRAWTPSGRPKKGDTTSCFTNEQMAAEAGVTVRTIQRAKRMEDEGHGDAIRKGDTTFAQVRRKERDKRTDPKSNVQPRTKMERMERARRDLQARNAELEGRIAVLEKAVEAAGKMDLVQEIDTLKEENRHLRVSGESQRGQQTANEILRDKLKESNRERDDLRGKLTESEGKCRDLQGKVERLKMKLWEAKRTAEDDGPS